MSRLFYITGKHYFEIVFQYQGRTLSAQYEGIVNAHRGKTDYKLLESEYNTYGDKAAAELMEYYTKRNEMLKEYRGE